MKSPTGEQLSPKRTYRIEFAGGRTSLALAKAIGDRPEAERERDRIAAQFGYDPAQLLVVGTTPAVAATESEDAPW